MRKSEKLSEFTKRKIVSEVLSGKMTKEQARRIYSIKSKSAILEWMRIFAGDEGKNFGFDPIPKLKAMDKGPDEIIHLESRIKQLEEELKISQMKGEAYQIMVDIAKQDFNLDLEKKFGAKQHKDSK